MMNIIDSKPLLFQKSDLSIWTDPYIQKQLLNAHLDMSSDAASRNRKSIDRTIDFIDKCISHNNKILDLGCGPGLYAQLLANKGHTVAGVDFNSESIRYARSKGDSIEYIEADYIKHFPEDSYDAIILIYCDMGTHSDNDRDYLLNNCYQALNPGGKMIFDVFNDKVVNDKILDNRWEFSVDGGFWSGNEYLLLKQTFHYPESHVFADQYNLMQNGNCKHFIMWERYYSEDEIKVILDEIGFTNVEIYENIISGNNFTSNNEMFVVATK